MRAADQFHAGIIVDDLDATLDDLSELFGYEWGDEVQAESPVRFPDGSVEMVPFRFRYSCSTPRLEVIQSRSGTLWVPAAGSGVHHLGYWSDDVAGDSAALEEAGYANEASGVDPEGAPMWAYHRSPDGPRIELLTRALQPLLAPLWGAESSARKRSPANVMKSSSGMVVCLPLDLR